MVSSKAGVSNLGASRDSPGWSLTTPACVGEQARLPCRALASSGGPWGVLVTPQQWVLPPGRSPPDHGELRATCGRMVPAWDGATLLPSTRLLLKRREVAEVERALQSQREAFQQRMERLAQRWQQLSQREEQFRDVVLEFDEVLKASAARQERLLRRADEERAQAAGQGAKATRLRRELAGLLRRRERLAQRLRSLRGFGEYLQGVLPSMGQFQDVPDMLAHFGALAGVRAALAQRAGARWEQLAQHRAQLRRYREEASSKLLCTNRVLLGPHPEHGRPEDPAAGASQAGSAAPLPARHRTAQHRHRCGPGGHRGPAGHGAALHAGPGRHLCRAAPWAASATSPLACSPPHALAV
ncbi:cilia- and flagella-associated protein 73 isoform X3 [Falco rusticolus]|uniref:cilia- and flagella-associated protein 73 isoform X3 n=1 Tax=Falco rusticolus TaxID=120794 RepID=UPI0018869D07|nr:cilia- and flagella-associated protein 73 isoform X3 [Falco rusticolus]